ncbi:putative AMP-dependent synthetase ligase [Rosellinia necatrix]|uniref:Putative AMP-dependent synthetase ligase n=1 Tax=Rosellinia necatrix TaxID=77044 RepID=A0A1S7ULN2_ROSNE|nr:putative AMP-dependent synthetase ligase [Rosellinia necatrix]
MMPLKLEIALGASPGSRTRTIVLDWSVGELLIEGPTVSRGYLNDPDKQAASFISYPEWLMDLRGDVGGKKLYRTGDMVKYSENGEIKFVGRKDTQVKLRGQRLELTDVEHHVRSTFPEAAMAIAEIVVSSTETHETMLVAFIWRGRGACTASDQSEEIIEYRSRPAAIRAPSSKMEIRLCELAARLVGLLVENIGLEDDFFHLGGDSIAAMRLTGATRQAGIDLTVPQIFSNPILSNLASVAKGLAHEGSGVRLRSAFRGFCERDVETIAGHWALSLDNIADILLTTEFQREYIRTRKSNYFTIPLPAQIDRQRLETAIGAVVERCATLRVAFVPHDDTFLQIVLKASDQFSSFADYLLWREDHDQLELARGWEEILQGSQMTYVSPATQLRPGRDGTEDPLILSRSLPSLRSVEGFTMATMHKATWALVLARRTRSRDLVFGQVMNGRNSALGSVMGACVHIMPVCVTLQTDWKTSDLLDTVQSQHARTMVLQAIDFEDIVSQGTGRPQNTTYGSVVQHQNIESSCDVTLDSITLEVDTYVPTSVPSSVHSTSVWEDDSLNVSLSAPTHGLDTETAEVLLEDLCNVLQRLSDNAPGAVLDTLGMSDLLFPIEGSEM